MKTFNDHFGLRGLLLLIQAFAISSLQAAAPTFQLVSSYTPTDSKTVKAFPYYASLQALSADGQTVVGVGFDHGKNYPYRMRNGFLERLPNSRPWEPAVVSTDGSIIAGVATSGTALVVCADGIVTLIPKPEQVASLKVAAISADGTVVAGLSQLKSGPPDVPFRWTSQTGVMLYPSQAGSTLVELAGMSSDGSVCIVNVRYPGGIRGIGKVCRWNGDGVVNWLPVPAEVTSYRANAVSQDGSVVGGTYESGGKSQVCRWAGEKLETFPSGPFFAFQGMSADGSVVLALDWSTLRIFRWTGTGCEPILDHWRGATAISADGSTVASLCGSGRFATLTVWDQQNGIRNLRTLMQRELMDSQLTNSWITRLAGVTNGNGKIVIAGNAEVPVDAFAYPGSIAVYNEGWVATLDAAGEPNPFAGDWLNATADFTPSVSLIETYKDKVVSTYNPPFEGEPGFYLRDQFATYSSHFSATVSMTGVDLSSLNANTPLQLILGMFTFSQKLGDDPQYTPGKANASFELTQSGTIPVGSLRCSWDAKSLIIKADIKIDELNPDDDTVVSWITTPGFAAPKFIAGTDGTFGGVFPLDLRFGDRTGSRNVAMRAKVIKKYVDYAEDSYVLDDIAANAQFDMVGPTVSILSPSDHATLIPSMVPLSIAASDLLGGIDHVDVSVNGGPVERAGIGGEGLWDLDLALNPGANTVRVQAFDESGNAGPAITRTFNVRAKEGTYTGLILDQGQIPRGLASITLTESGNFTGKLLYDGRSLSLKGLLGADGKITLSLPMRGSSPMSLSLVLTTDGMGNSLRGDFGQPAGFSFDAARSLYNKAAPFALYTGTFSLLVAPSGNEHTPPGYGVASLAVDATGLVKLVGKLSDGTAIVTRAKLDGRDSLPVYLRPYKTGLFAGSLQFRDLVESDCDGQFRWTKPAQAKGLYASGFDQTVSAAGDDATNELSFRLFPKITMENEPNADFVFSGGNLSVPYKVGAIGPEISAVPSRPAGFKYSSPSGKFIDLGSNSTRTFFLGINSKMNLAAGFFLGSTEAGLVEIVPRQ